MTKTDPTLDGTTVTVTGLKLKIHHQNAWKLNRTHEQARWASARRQLCPQPLYTRAYEAGGRWALLIILEMKKGRLSEGKGLLQGHIAYEQHSKHVLQAVNGNQGQAVSHQARQSCHVGKILLWATARHSGWAGVRVGGVLRPNVPFVCCLLLSLPYSSVINNEGNGSSRVRA